MRPGFKKKNRSHVNRFVQMEARHRGDAILSVGGISASATIHYG